LGQGKGGQLMPTYEIQAPNGKTYRIEGPDGASDEDVRAEVLRQFPDAAGDMASKAEAKVGNYSATYDVQPGATDEQVLRASRAALSAKYPGVDFERMASGEVTRPSATDSARTAAANLSTNLGVGVAGTLEILAKPGELLNNAVRDVARFAVTGGGASKNPSRNALADFVDPNMGPSASQAIANMNPGAASSGSALGAQVLGGAVIPLGPKAATTPRIAPNALANTEKAATAGAKPNPAAVAVREAEQARVRLMTSDLKPPKTFVGKAGQKLGEMIPIAGTGGERAAQQAERIEAIKTFALDFGADDVADDVAADLAKTRGAAIEKYTNTKKQILSRLSGEVPAPQTLKAIDEQIANLSKVGTDAAKSVIAKLENWKQALQVAGQQVSTGILDASGQPIVRNVPAQGKDLKTIELIRKEMGEAFKGAGMENIRSTGEAALSKIYGPIRADMGSFIKTRGGQSAFEKWKEANDNLAAMAGELKDTKLRNVLRNVESTPESVSRLLFSRNPSDVRRLYSNLSADGRVKAQAALLHKALGEAGVKSIDELDNVSPEKFVTAMQRYGKATGIVFDPADKARLDGLARTLQMTQRASTAGVMTNTGQQVLPYAVPAVFTQLFGLMGGTVVAGGIGLIARAYESPAVRNALLKLGRTKPGSKAESSMLERAGASIALYLERNPPMNDNIPVSPGVAAAQEEAPSGGEPPQQ
jgi:hypothetical protein